MGSLNLGSLANSIGADGSTGNITDTIAETIGDFVATALKSVLGNLS